MSLVMDLPKNDKVEFILKTIKVLEISLSNLICYHNILDTESI